MWDCNRSTATRILLKALGKTLVMVRLYHSNDFGWYHVPGLLSLRSFSTLFFLAGCKYSSLYKREMLTVVAAGSNGLLSATKIFQNRRTSTKATTASWLTDPFSPSPILCSHARRKVHVSRLAASRSRASATDASRPPISCENSWNPYMQPTHFALRIRSWASARTLCKCSRCQDIHATCTQCSGTSRTRERLKQIYGQFVVSA